MRSMKKIYVVVLVVIGTMFSCNDKYPDLEDGIYAEFITSEGVMVTELYYDDAPATVANFVALAEGTHPGVDSIYAGKPFYNGLKFHRILKDFMIQGGDPLGTGSGNPGYRFHDELSPDRRHDTIGMLSMANAGYRTNGSQFFILNSVRSYLDGYDANGNLKDCENPQVYCHTIWGKLIIGYDVLEKISSVPVTGPRKSTPVDPVLINEVNIIRKGGAAKSFNAPQVFEAEVAEEEKRQEEVEKAKLAVTEGIKTHYETQKADVETLPTGLQIHWQNRGQGQKLKIGDNVLVDYAVYFPSGELLDTSMESAAKASNKLDAARAQAGAYQPYPMQNSPDAALITGVKDALKIMRVGDKATLFIPYHLAYGERGRRGIPPKTDLIFEMEVKGMAE